MANPATTEFSANATPCTMPTRPLAFARFGAGTRIVTQVASANERMDSTTVPTSSTSTKPQKAGPPRSSSLSAGISKNITAAIANAPVVAAVATTIAVFLRTRSISVPNGTLSTAISSMYPPPNTEVTSTERVSRYAQKVSPNQTMLVVMLASRVFTKIWWNVRINAPRGSAGRCQPSTQQSDSRHCSRIAPRIGWLQRAGEPVTPAEPGRTPTQLPPSGRPSPPEVRPRFTEPACRTDCRSAAGELA